MAHTAFNNTLTEYFDEYFNEETKEVDLKFLDSQVHDAKLEDPEDYYQYRSHLAANMNGLNAKYLEEMKKQIWNATATGLLIKADAIAENKSYADLVAELQEKGLFDSVAKIAHWLDPFEVISLCDIPYNSLGHMEEYWDNITKDKVPIPTKDYGINPKLSEKWIRSATSDEMKKTRRKFINEIIYVSFPDFLGYLQDCAAQFMAVIVDNPYVISLSVYAKFEKYKSAAWMVSLLKTYTADFPSPTDIILDEPEFAKYVQNLPRSETLCQLNVLFVDDISFSGQQLLNAINLIKAQLLNNAFVDIHVHIIVPIISSYSHDLLQKMIQSDSVYLRFHIHLYTAKIIPIFSKDVREALNLWDTAASSTVYSAHKLPDEVSVPTTLMAPLISNCEYAYYNKDGTLKDFDSFKPPCPWPPYKPPQK
jgi:hypothetical protein